LQRKGHSEVLSLSKPWSEAAAHINRQT